MFLSRRKKTYCQNCHYPLSGNYNYCPECGQQNIDKLVSFDTLIGEFFSNYFSYDSRLIRTIKPFLFKPGLLTKEFIAGRRTKFMHPLRLYLIISFLYFFMFSFMVSHDGEDKKVLNFSKTSAGELDNASLALSEDSLKQTIASGINLNPPSSSQEIASDNDDYYGDFNFNSLRILVKEEVSPKEVLQTFDLEQTPVKLNLAKQAIKLANERQQNIKNYIIKNASIMMFILLPFIALVLKLFYIRRKKYYIEHITFMLHTHSFMFLLLFLVTLINYIWPNVSLLSFAIILIFVYFLLAFKNVYQQSWGKTTIKMALLGLGYVVSFGIFLLFTVALSLYTY